MRRRAFVLSIVLMGTTGLLVTANAAQAAIGCRVDYAISSSWLLATGALNAQ